MKKLHLGCGINKKEGWINIDQSSEVKPDLVWDLEKTPLPFEDNSVDEVLAEHTFEHIHRFIELMHDLRRVCIPNAKLHIRVPFYNSPEQYTDPTHVRFFSPFTFDYFDTNSRISAFSHEVNATTKLFTIEKVYLRFSVGRLKILNTVLNPLINFNHRFYCKFIAGILPAAEIYFELIVKK